jgi:hypothetical protein
LKAPVFQDGRIITPYFGIVKGFLKEFDKLNKFNIF